ncbi:hypothetical protein C2G38_2018086 [Gigaspora rosea]|uniref:CDP-diacylglycerol--glycerol-3-phosphate 3-phosphatidyltransferase n=1 Tax=Gigaspora rosea TaxID=44941 RepID=A0A397V1X2_9GLOM|nr:hypothetical protein C2G38_2018086 [Gigaspora rosea]
MLSFTNIALSLSGFRHSFSRGFVFRQGFRLPGVTSFAKRLVLRRSFVLRFSPALGFVFIPLSKIVSPNNNLFTLAPYFLLDGKQIRPLREPYEFYDQLKAQILAAKERIFLAALYIGSEEKELIETLRIAIRKSSNLKVHILLDCLRATRGGKSHKDQSPADLLAPLVKEFPDQVTVSLYHTPDLKGILKIFLPSRFNEGIGLMHIKAFGFDNNLILSGANLSHNYFNNRQDRYMLFTNVPNLTNYFDDLIKTIATFSYILKPDENSFKLVLPNILDPSSQSKWFKKHASLIMKCFIEKWMKKGDIRAHQLEQFDTIAFPVIQMAPLDIRQDETATLYILDTIAKCSSICYHNKNMYWQVFFTSGYFNFTQKYKERILNSTAKFRLLAASPEANGFYGSKGISKYIPMAYTFIEYQFFNDIIHYGKGHLIKIEEYKRQNWTFHAKGLWCYLNEQQWPSLTIIGSSNYGHRSTERDLEAQVILITTNDSLKKAMHDELNHLRENTIVVTNETFAQVNRKVPYLFRIITKIIKTMF